MQIAFITTGSPSIESRHRPIMTSTTIPLISGKQHPEWRPAGPNDVRSPCPALNAMANHSIISHDGRNLTSAMLQTALKETYNTNPLMSRLAIIGGTLAPHLFFRSTFNLDDLQRQKMFKHDGLFGRPDFNTGEDVNEFSAATWESVMAHFHGQPETSFDTVAEARYGRIKEAIERHPKTVKYGSICYVLSYGEIAALLAVFADRETGSASVEYLNIFFGMSILIML